MPMFRKLPVIIEAYRLPPAGQEPSDGLIFFLHDNGIQSDYDEGVSIETLEGVMRGDPGDWIIKGVNGECYPCKPDIFAKTYEPA